MQRSRALAVPAAILVAILLPLSFAQASCPNPSALGVARIVEIDATGGPVFGHITKQARETSFLRPKEVVLTFDDGPMPGITRPILDTLDRHCTKATFFSVGRMAIAYPVLVRDILARGHTLGTHTWSHPMSLPRLKGEQARDQIESGFAAVALAAGQPIAPFFRFPGLNDSSSLLGHLEGRGIATFTVDVVSNDSYIADSGRLIERTLAALEAEGGGIMLFHDIKPQTARALPVILAELKSRGYRVVHLQSKQPFEADVRYVASVREHIAQRNPAALRALVALTDTPAAPAPAVAPAAPTPIAAVEGGAAAVLALPVAPAAVEPTPARTDAQPLAPVPAPAVTTEARPPVGAVTETSPVPLAAPVAATRGTTANEIAVVEPPAHRRKARMVVAPAAIPAAEPGPAPIVVKAEPAPAVASPAVAGSYKGAVTGAPLEPPQVLAGSYGAPRPAMAATAAPPAPTAPRAIERPWTDSLSRRIGEGGS